MNLLLIISLALNGILFFLVMSIRKPIIKEKDTIKLTEKQIEFIWYLHTMQNLSIKEIEEYIKLSIKHLQ